MLLKLGNYRGSPGERRRGGGGGSYKHPHEKEGWKIHGSQGYRGGGGSSRNNYNNQGSHHHHNDHHRGNYRGRNDYNQQHSYNNHGNNNNSNSGRYHRKEELPLLSRVPPPPALRLLKESKKKSLTARTLNPVQQVRTFDQWAACYFQDYHIKYNQEEKKWERTDISQIAQNTVTSPSGKLIAAYYEKYYEDYDGWCLQREHIANGTVGPISVPVAVKSNRASFEPGLELGLGLGLGYNYIHPLPPHFIEDEAEEDEEEEEKKSSSDGKESNTSPAGFVGEIDEKGTFSPSRISGESKEAIRHCYNKDKEIIGIDRDNDLILRTPYADRFSRSDSLSPGAAKRPHWELGADGKAHVKAPSSSGDTKSVNVASTISNSPQFWRDVAGGKAKIPLQLQSSKIPPSLFVEYRVPYFVPIADGKKKIYVPEADEKISTEKIIGKCQFLQWVAKQERIAKSSPKSQRAAPPPTSTASTALSPNTPLTPEGKQRQLWRHQKQLVTVAAPVPVPVFVPVPDLPCSTHLNGDTVKIYLGDYIGSLNRAGPPELPEEDLELILCQALQLISSSLPPDQNSTIAYEKLLYWYRPIATSVSQFKNYRSLTLLEQEAKQKELEQKVARWRKRFEEKDSVKET